MKNIDNFKSFVKKNPHLTNYVKNGSMTWQKFYEIYDLYGEDNNVWSEYSSIISKREDRTLKSSSGVFNFSNIIEMAKHIDTNKVQEGITSIQKAISLFGDMLSKDGDNTSSYTPRPIYRRFDD